MYCDHCQLLIYFVLYKWVGFSFSRIPESVSPCEFHFYVYNLKTSGQQEACERVLI